MASKSEAITAIREFNRFYTSLLGLLNQHIYDSPYSLAEVRVLYEIYHSTGITAKTIKETLQMDEGYLSRIIEKFAGEKMINKVRSAQDGRLYFITLTQKGRAIFLQLNKASDASIAGLIQSLPEKDIRSLVNMMTGIRSILSQS